MTQNQSKFLVHRCRFADISPNGILSIKHAPVNYNVDDIIAVGRHDGSVEIWKTNSKKTRNRAKNGMFLFKRLPGISTLAPKALCWSYQTQLSSGKFSEIVLARQNPKQFEAELKKKPARLFSCSLNGMLCEWDFEQIGLPRIVESGAAGGVWALDVSPNQLELASACEDGIIRVFDISDGKLEYHRSTVAGTQRCLAVKFSPCGKFLYGGYANSVVVKYDSQSGRAISKIHLDAIRVERSGRAKGTRKRQTAVWALDVIPDTEIIVTGDSLGTVQFWDMESSSLVRSFEQAHKSDVLALCVDASGQKVWSAGVDRAIAEFNFTGAPEFWVFSGSKKYHSHDIRALSHNKRCDKAATLLSGGVDASLIAAFPTNVFLTRQLQVLRKHPLPHYEAVRVAPSDKALAIQSPQHVDIYRLGGLAGIDNKLPNAAELESSDDLSGLGLTEQYQFVARLKGKAISNYVTCAPNPECSLIAISDLSSTKVYQVKYNAVNSEFPTQIDRVSLDTELGAATHLHFSRDSKYLFAALNVSRACKMVKYSLESVPQVRVQCVIEQKPVSSADSLNGSVGAARILAFSPSESLFAVAYEKEPRVFVYSSSDFQLKGWSSMTFSASVSALTFISEYQLAAMTVSGDFVVLNTESSLLPVHKVTEKWAKHVPRALSSMLLSSPCLQMTSSVSSTGHSLLCLWTIEGCWIVDLGILDKEFDGSKAASKTSKRKRLVPVGSSDQSESLSAAFHPLTAYKPLIYGGFMNDSELLMVEVPLLDQLEKLPASFNYRKFNT